MTRVLALDPGEKVGWARADVADDGTWTDLRHGITALRDMALAVHKALIYPTIESETMEYPEWDQTITDYDLIVMESWVLYPHMAQSMTGSSFPSVQFVGMVRLCCWLSGCKLVMQGASVKKHALKSMKTYNPELHDLVTRTVKHDDGHDQDALMHLWFWSFKNRLVPSLQGVV